MKKYKDIEIGDTFGRLTVVEKGKRENYKQFWICKCSCENSKLKEINEFNLKNGHIKSCGCLQYEAILANCRNRHTKTFQEWCLENNLQKYLDLWDYNKNKITPNDVSYKTNKKYWFKCPKGIHKSELHRLDNTTIYFEKYGESLKCSQCNSFAQWGINNICEDFLEKYWDYEKNIVNPFEIPYSWNKKVWIKCQEKDYHGSYEIACNNFQNGKRCPFCVHKVGKIHKFDSLGYLYPQVLEIWSDKNDKTPFEYSPSSNLKVWWKCDKHGDYLRMISQSTSAEFRCPECVQERDESLLQEKVRLYLNNELKYKTNHEYKCTIIPKQPKNHHLLPFDNEVIDLKLIIEVNGLAHYKIDNFIIEAARKHNITSEEESRKRRLYDRYKRFIAYCNGYFYLAIPYWTDNKNEDWKKLIDDKVNQIIKKSA